MKKTVLFLLSILLTMTVTGCSEEHSTNSGIPKDSGLTGKKFVDAAATKIMLHNEGMNRKRANCVVSYITADGKIGVGEINQMHLTSKTMPQNSERLNKSYSAAIQNCQ